MFLWLKRLSGTIADGQWFSGRPDVASLDLDRDWGDIHALLEQDGLGHGQQDVAGWLAVDGAVGLVARKEGRFAGFFVGHPVGHVAHVDVVAVAPEFRRSSIARPLYFRGVNALKVGGARGFVAHAREEPGRLLELLGYRRTATFHMLQQEVGEVTVAGGHRGELVDEHEMTVDEIAALDAAVFGADRMAFLQHLFYRDDTEIYGFRKKGEIIAFIVFERADDGLVVRVAAGREFRDISNLLHVAMVMNSGRRIRCLVRQGSKLDAMFESLDFEPPEGDAPIHEYRLGDTAGVGDGEGVLQLSWW